MFSNIKKRISGYLNDKRYNRKIKDLDAYLKNESNKVKSYIKFNCDLSNYELDLLDIRLNRLMLEARQHGVCSIYKENGITLQNIVSSSNYKLDILIPIIFNVDHSRVKDIEEDNSYLLNNDGNRLFRFNKDLYKYFQNKFFKYWGIWDNKYKHLYKNLCRNDGVLRFTNNDDGAYNYDISVSSEANRKYYSHLCLTYWLYVKLLYNTQNVNISNIDTAVSRGLTEGYSISYKLKDNPVDTNLYYNFYTTFDLEKGDGYLEGTDRIVFFKDMCSVKQGETYLVFDHICKLTLLDYLFRFVRLNKPNKETWDKLDSIYKSLIEDNIGTSLDPKLMLSVNNYLYSYCKGDSGGYYKTELKD